MDTYTINIDAKQNFNDFLYQIDPIHHQISDTFQSVVNSKTSNAQHYEWNLRFMVDGNLITKGYIGFSYEPRTGRTSSLSVYNIDWSIRKPINDADVNFFSQDNDTGIAQAFMTTASGMYQAVSDYFNDNK